MILCECTRLITQINPAPCQSLAGEAARQKGSGDERRRLGKTAEKCTHHTDQLPFPFLGRTKRKSSCCNRKATSYKLQGDSVRRTPGYRLLLTCIMTSTRRRTRRRLLALLTATATAYSPHSARRMRDDRRSLKLEQPLPRRDVTAASFRS